MLQINEIELESLIKFARDTFGVNLENKRSLIEGRLNNILVQRGYQSFGEYLNRIYEDISGQELCDLVSLLTTNYSYFMREWEHFDYLKSTVLPLLEKKIKDYDLRVWSAGCSSGEEAYTIAMILSDYFGRKKHLWDTSTLATDISKKALKTAEAGIYNENELERLFPHWKLNYFTALGEGKWQVNDEIRRNVIIRSFNLMEPLFPFKKRFHVIFCRNVMIYFDQQTKENIINKLYDFTEPGGYLFIGQSESISRDDTDYEYIMPSVYRRRQT